MPVTSLGENRNTEVASVAVRRDHEVRWHLEKAAANVRKHGVSFDEAATAMCDVFAVTSHDARSTSEERYLLIAESKDRRILVVCFTIDDDGGARLISARRANPAERRSYMNEKDMIRDTPVDDDEMLDDYSHLQFRRSPFKFVRLCASVTLEPDVYNVFRTSEQVNEALRELIREGRVPA